MLGDQPDRTAEQTIRSIVELACEIGESACEAWLRDHPEAFGYFARLRRAYHDYIVGMETREIRRLLENHVGQGADHSFEKIAGLEAMRAYQRVQDLFTRPDIRACRRFVMVGCGQLPVTAIQALAHCPAATVTALDPEPRAIEATERLGGIFGWERLRPIVADGRDFDYRDADVIYVANMVSPKTAVLARVLATAPERINLIVREPYSLGRLWAESAEGELDPRLSVVGRGPGSHYLSRDVFLRTRTNS